MTEFNEFLLYFLGSAIEEHLRHVTEFNEFLFRYRAVLRRTKDTVLDLIASQGRVDALLYFATLIGMWWYTIYSIYYVIIESIY